MKSEKLITAPAAEPVSVADMLVQLQMNAPSDPTLAANQAQRLADMISAARESCENYTRSVYLTQTWLLRLDGFPGADWNYNWRGYPTINVPKPPLQSIEFLQYVDTFGAVQTLPRDISYGNSGVQYAYQLERGGEVEAARVLSAWSRPWPPTRMVASNVMMQFRAGFGGPITCSVQQGQTALTASMTFNPDDAPQMAAETGLAISIPGAGAGKNALATYIASVDANGNATLADAPAYTVDNATAWIGSPVPVPILRAIKMLTEFFWEQGSIVDQPLPRIICDQLDPYRNLVA